MQEFDYEFNYIKGKENVVADALSRKHKKVHEPSASILKKLLNITTVKVSENILEKLNHEYQNDEHFENLYNTPKEPYLKKNNKLYLEKNLCIPTGSSRLDILKGKPRVFIRGSSWIQENTSAD